MLPPGVAEDLLANGHEAVTPEGLGAQDLSDEQLVDIATAEGRVIVTENASDFAYCRFGRSLPASPSRNSSDRIDSSGVSIPASLYTWVLRSGSPAHHEVQDDDVLNEPLAGRQPRVRVERAAVQQRPNDDVSLAHGT